MAGGITHIFPAHAQALITAMKEKQETEQHYLRACQSLNVLLELLGLPTEDGVTLQVSGEGRVEITQPPKLEKAPANLFIARN